MDTTETYIKMCKKATEIQEGKPQDGVGGRWLKGSIIVNDGFQGERGDFYHIVDTNEERVCKSCGNAETYIECTKSTWLPRRDQLQEMSGLDWRDFDKKCLAYENTVSVPTKEQAGLRVVMSEKYGKFWSDGDWVTA